MASARNPVNFISFGKLLRMFIRAMILMRDLWSDPRYRFLPCVSSPNSVPHNVESEERWSRRATAAWTGDTVGGYTGGDARQGATASDGNLL
jgi:hypothetical protein